MNGRLHQYEKREESVKSLKENQMNPKNNMMNISIPEGTVYGAYSPLRVAAGTVLGSSELDIIRKKRRRSGAALCAESLVVEYRALFPRITLCIIKDIETSTFYYGATMRSKRDRHNQESGRNIAFVRAVNVIIRDHMERTGREEQFEFEVRPC